MEAYSSETQELFGLNWDPNAVLVGDITSKVRDSENGVHLVAEHKGVRLWAEILNGNAIDYRAFAEDGSELGIVEFIEPGVPAGNPPPDGGVPGDGGVPDDGGVPGVPGDGGVPGVPGVPGYGGRKCHKVCIPGLYCVWKC